ncbi:hypothetical protein PG985_001520 [Apiospora marii]|uniref:DUF7580 domain-containing protein n=1 Tax=Apiospora marii TaxID=335849 RepID=A0ABR1RJ45_9PEZI
MIIEGIKLYREVAGKNTRRGFLMRLETLTVELDAEYMILKNTRDIILYDIKASTSVAFTGGSGLGLENWKEGGNLHQRVEERLGSSANSFRQTAQQMEAVIIELMAKLGMDKAGKACPSLFPFLIYIPLANLCRLGRSNQRLRDLTQQSAELAPKTRSKTRGRLISLTRGLLSNVYNALSGSLSCTCTRSHGVNLQLENYPTSVLKHGDEDMATEGIAVHAVLSFDPPWHQCKCASWRWEEVQIQKSALQFSLTPDLQSIQLTKPSRLRRKERSKECSTEVLISKKNVAVEVGSPSDSDLLFNLCETFRSTQEVQPQAPYGYVLDRSTAGGCRLRISSLCHGEDDWTPFTLKDILLRRGERIPRLAFKHKVKLAPILARTLLQLSPSSWLPAVLTSEHIIFIRRPTVATFYDCVYVSKSLPERPPSAYKMNCERKFDLPSDYTEDEGRLFSLGILLMELVLGATWESIRDSATSSSDIDVAEECLSRVQAEGDHYYRAIKCCIEFEFLEPEADLDKAPFRQEVYDKVVGLLEDNLS